MPLEGESLVQCGLNPGMSRWLLKAQRKSRSFRGERSMSWGHSDW